MSPIVVFKVGGSLLNLPDLADRLRSVMSQRASSRCALVIGGGEIVDVVRSWSERFALPETAAHWIAIESLRTTAALIVTMLPDTVRCDSEAECHAAWERGNLPVLDCLSFCRRDASLPVGWHVTSDSIAARIASVLEASELVLLKSVSLRGSNRIGNDDRPDADASVDDQVDAWFTAASANLPVVSWCDLREPSLTILQTPQIPARRASECAGE